MDKRMFEGIIKSYLEKSEHEENKSYSLEEFLGNFEAHCIAYMEPRSITLLLQDLQFLIHLVEWREEEFTDLIKSPISTQDREEYKGILNTLVRIKETLKEGI